MVRKKDVAGMPLTARERQVVECLLKGKTSAACAEELGLSPRTVDLYRAIAMHKLELTSPVQLGYVFGYSDGQGHAVPAARSPHPIHAPPGRLRRLPYLAKATG